jgi:hypothetical protein
MKNILVARDFTYKLKCVLLIVLFLVVNFLSEGRAAPAARPQIPPPGLFQRLIKIKYSSELYLISKAKESGRLNRPETLDSALAVYNTIRWNLDGLVYQLSGDLVSANSPRKLRQLNLQIIQNLERLCSDHIPAFSLINEMPEEESQQGTRNINLTTNVFYLIKDSYSLIKGLSDLKTQKTMALVEILDQMRLASPQELLKQVK